MRFTNNRVSYLLTVIGLETFKWQSGLQDRADDSANITGYMRWFNGELECPLRKRTVQRSGESNDLNRTMVGDETVQLLEKSWNSVRIASYMIHSINNEHQFPDTLDANMKSSPKRVFNFIGGSMS